MLLRSCLETPKPRRVVLRVSRIGCPLIESIASCGPFDHPAGSTLMLLLTTHWTCEQCLSSLRLSRSYDWIQQSLDETCTEYVLDPRFGFLMGLDGLKCLCDGWVKMLFCSFGICQRTLRVEPRPFPPSLENSRQSFDRGFGLDWLL